MAEIFCVFRKPEVAIKYFKSSIKKSPKIQKPIHKKTSIKLDKESSKVSKPVKVGSRVRIPGYTKTGVVQVLKSKQAEILVGNFMVSIKISDLSVVE